MSIVPRFVVALVALTAIASQASAQFEDKMPKSPTGKPQPKYSVSVAALRALDACSDAMTAHGNNPALASDEEYRAYVQARDAVVAKDPHILAFDASVAISRDRTPSKMFPVCTRYFDDYRAGVNAADAPLSPYCERRFRAYMKNATERLADHKKDSWHHISEARTHLEWARFVLAGPDDDARVARCSANDKLKKASAPLKAQLASLEAQIVAAETARGVKFVPGKDLLAGKSFNDWIYVDLATNQKIVGDV